MNVKLKCHWRNQLNAIVSGVMQSEILWEIQEWKILKSTKFASLIMKIEI